LAWSAPSTGASSISLFSPPFKDEGEVVATWGDAQLIKYLDRKLELKGGSKADRLAAHEWISLFWHEAVVGESPGHYKS
jgi:hypothetical protein